MSDQILEYIKDSVDRIEQKQDKHDERLGRVENWQANANGKISATAAIGAALGGMLTGLFEYFRH